MNEDILTRFRKGIECFNKEEFYECHDILEDVWYDVRGRSRRFYQGLIHLAVGFYHIIERKNTKGALSQLNKGIDKLSDYKPSFQGVELEALIENTGKCIEEIRLIQAGDIKKFKPSKIPQIKFNISKFVVQH